MLVLSTVALWKHLLALLGVSLLSSRALFIFPAEHSSYSVIWLCSKWLNTLVMLPLATEAVYLQCLHLNSFCLMSPLKSKMYPNDTQGILSRYKLLRLGLFVSSVFSLESSMPLVLLELKVKAAMGLRHVTKHNLLGNTYAFSLFFLRGQFMNTHPGESINWNKQYEQLCQWELQNVGLMHFQIIVQPCIWLRHKWGENR